MSYRRREIEYTPQELQEAAQQTAALLDDYKAQSRQHNPRLLTDAQFRTFHACRIAAPAEENPFRKADEVFQSGSYSKFEKLKPGAVAYECTKLFYQLREEFGDDGLRMEHPDFRAYALENLHNPFFRLTMEMAANTPDLAPEALRQSCAAVGVALNERMMLDTLRVPTQTQRENLTQALGSAEKAEREITKNRLTQMTLAKTMFLSHFGTYHVVDADGRNAPYRGSLTETLAHGGRTVFYFSKGEPGENTIERMVFHDLRPDGDRGTAVASRFAATHGIKGEAKEEGAGAFREVSSKMDVSDNYGMNTAVGGLGNRFGEKVMRNNGESGHYYIKKHESSDRKGGYMMVGMEGSETFARGKTGRLHFGGGSSMASAFLSGKGAPGAKLGGRLVDLSIWDHDALGAILRKFNEAYGALQDDAYRNLPGAQARLTRIHEKLSGRMLNGRSVEPDGTVHDDLAQFLREDLGIRTVTIRNHEVDVDSLCEYRAHHGARNFEALNRAVERRMQQPPERREEYIPSPEFEVLASQLEAAKRYVFGREKDSEEMKQVKNALEQTLLLVRDPDVSEKAMKRQLQVLQEKAGAYLSQRSGNNLRKQIVGNIYALARREEQRVDRALARQAARARALSVPELPHRTLG